MAVPIISSVTPANGPAAAATFVTILGSNFAFTADVRFGGVSVNWSDTIVMDDRIFTYAPVHDPGLVTVEVQTPFGTASLNAFTYFQNCEPPSGPDVGGNTVQITYGGSSMTGATSVKFGGAECPSFEVINGSRIDAVMPPRPKGLSNCVITVPGGTITLVACYRFLGIEAVMSAPTNPNATIGQDVSSIAGLRAAFGPGAAIEAQGDQASFAVRGDLIGYMAV